MAHRDDDRNLLCGVLALQLDLIDARQFVEACTAWAACKEVPLAELLCERGWITPEDRADLERLLKRKVDRHRGDVRKSLATLTSGQVGAVLAEIDDFEIHNTLATLVSDDGRPAVPTVVPTQQARDHFPLARLLAQGGLGRIWLARDPDLGREVALKELRSEWADEPWHRARFLEEARITGQLEHPNIVPVYELVLQQGDRRPFYVMKHVQGRTLSSAIREFHKDREACQSGPLDLRLLMDAFVAVCNAVGYAHSRGVIHRDLKGENIILGEYGEVVVLDWGLAKLVDRPESAHPTPPVALEGWEDRQVTKVGQLLGTPGYMAPEQAEGRLEAIGPGTDIYGLGAVLYEILTGHPPFRGQGAWELLRQAREEDPASPHQVCPSVPAPLAAICLRALARRPENRYGSAAELAGEVRRWLADEPVKAYRERPLEKLGRWSRRHRPVVVGVAALVLAATVALAVNLVLVGREQARTATALHAEANQRKRAEASFKLAREVVDRLYYRISENRLLYEPHMDPLRRELLQGTLDFYRKLADTGRDDPGLRYHLGYAHLRLARILVQQGATSEAIDHGRSALAILKALVQEYPENPVYNSDLAHGHFELASALRESRQPKEAEAEYEAARALWERLSRTDQTRSYESQLATTYDALGELAQSAGDFERAESAHAQALAIWERLAGDRRNSAAARADRRKSLAHCQMCLANLYFRTERWKAAEDYFQRARRTWEEQERETSTPNALNKLAYIDQGLGKLYEATGRRPEAVSHQTRALELRKRLVADHPEVVEYEAALAGSHHRLAELYNPANHPPGQADLAESHYRAALDVWDRLARQQEDPMPIQNEQAKEYFGLGQVARSLDRPADARTCFGKAKSLWDKLVGESRNEFEQKYRAEIQRYLGE